MLGQNQIRPGKASAQAGGQAAGAQSDGNRLGAEHNLQEALRRAGRSPRGRVALVLHLSRLAPPGPRPHHRRVARAILDDTARRHEGEVFALANGDMVLLCRSTQPLRSSGTATTAGQKPPDPTALPGTMARLLRVDMPDPARVTSFWWLEESLPALAAYAAERSVEVTPARQATTQPDPGLPAQINIVDALALIAEGSALGDVMRRQTGVAVGTLHGAGGGAIPALQPFYHEVTFSIAALEARVAAAGQAAADPFLFRHLAQRLDRRMIAALTQAAAAGDVLDISAATRGAPPLHVNLTLPGILSDEFSRFAKLCRATGARVGITVPLVEACEDPGAFGRARRLLAESGLTLVLDGVSYLSLMLARPFALGPDLMKLDWIPGLADLAPDESEMLAAALERVGLHRVVLHHAETEAALRWGMKHGIRRFQGRHADAILAATRTIACPGSAACGLRLCMERGASVGAAGRAGCGFTALLDDTVPADHVPRPPPGAGEPWRPSAP